MLPLLDGRLPGSGPASKHDGGFYSSFRSRSGCSGAARRPDTYNGSLFHRTLAFVLMLVHPLRRMDQKTK
ncbi:MAG: hypothetical protein U5K69_14340 [Balneolaceae bacterium]|nr:hypothetical protein [Balneolaceae bacterium]